MTQADVVMARRRELRRIAQEGRERKERHERMRQHFAAHTVAVSTFVEAMRNFGLTVTAARERAAAKGEIPIPPSVEHGMQIYQQYGHSTWTTRARFTTTNLDT